MQNDNYTTSFEVAQTPEQVFAAVQDARGWWSEDIRGRTQSVGDVWYYTASDLHRCTLEVAESVPCKRIAWKVLDNTFSFTQDKSEWIGSLICFDIERQTEATKLTFTHVGLAPDHECYNVCEDAWRTYINGSLKRLIVEGSGTPNKGAELTARKPTDIAPRNFTTTFAVAQTPEQVFAAIIDPRAWWSGDHEGRAARLGDTFTYRYKDIHYSKQRVTELVEGTRVAWHVTEGRLNFVEDKTEWAGTTITFDISRHDGRTHVTFTHVGLEPSVECYDTCSDAWTSLIQGSLKQLIETGQTELLELDAPAA